MSVRPSVCLHGTTRIPRGRIFMKFDIGGFFENLSRKFKFHQNRTRIKVTLHEDQYTCFIISLSFDFRMKTFQTKYVEKIKTHILCSIRVFFFLFFFFLFENRAVYETMWKNILERGRPIWCMRIACWIPKATNTHKHTGCVILNVFPLQQWLHERASMFDCTYIACLFLLPVDITL